MKRFGLICSSGFMAFMVGCSADGTSTTASEIAASVDTVLQGSEADHEQATQCFSAFDACRQSAADDAARTACRATLESCLPDRPDMADRPPRRPGGGGPGGAGMCDGGTRPPPPLDADGNPLPPPVDADGNPLPPPPRLDADGNPLPPPPRLDADGNPLPPPPMGEDGRPARPPMHCGFGGPAARACRDALHTCLTDGTSAQAACLATAHECVHSAIVANFQATCERHVTRCRAIDPTSTVCDDLAATCAAGVPLPDDAPAAATPAQ